MERIEITRSEYTEEWGHTPEPDDQGMIIYNYIGGEWIPWIEYVFVDEKAAQAEIDWLEKLYSL